MKILITGAAGFIGSNLSAKFLENGHKVIGVDNFLTGSIFNINRFQSNNNFSFIEHDVIKPLKLELDIDWILHFASPASPPKYHRYPIETLRVNSEGTYHLLELAQAKKAKFLLASTSEVYGDPLIHPQVENYWGNVNPIGPRSIYDEAKRYAEAITMSYSRTNKVDTRIIRIFNTYGPYMEANDGRVVTNFINQALQNQPFTIYGDGSQTRSFQYIDDLIKGILKVMDKTSPGPINLGNPEEFTILELANHVQELMEAKIELSYHALPEDDPKQRRPDINVAIKNLNWKPIVPLKEGLKTTIEYFKRICAP